MLAFERILTRQICSMNRARGTLVCWNWLSLIHFAPVVEKLATSKAKCQKSQDQSAEKKDIRPQKIPKFHQFSQNSSNGGGSMRFSACCKAHCTLHILKSNKVGTWVLDYRRFQFVCLLMLVIFNNNQYVKKHDRLLCPNNLMDWGRLKWFGIVVR